MISQIRLLHRKALRPTFLRDVGGVGVCLIVLCCGAPSAPPPSIVAQTARAEDTQSASDTDSLATTVDTGDASVSPIAQLIERDAHTARDILVNGLHAADPELASFAAVYIRLLRVEADEQVVAQQLRSGAQSDNLLLKTLCYRWLANDGGTDIPESTAPVDPLLQLFAALSQLSNPDADTAKLSQILAVGAATAYHEEKDSLNTLLQQTAPFDNGPLALAIAFVNARRMSLATEVEGVTVPLSAQYRHKLLVLLGIHHAIAPPASEADAVQPTATAIYPLLENPLAAQPVQALRNIIVSGGESLRRDALRAMASAAVQPEVGDFAATASAFQSQNAQVQLEAARTFLLLVTRATKD